MYRDSDSCKKTKNLLSVRVVYAHDARADAYAKIKNILNRFNSNFLTSDDDMMTSRCRVRLGRL